MAIIVALTIHALARLLDALDRQQAATQSDHTAVIDARVLGHRDRRDTLTTERYSQRADQNRSRNRDAWSGRERLRDGTMSWTPRRGERFNPFGDWDDDEELDARDELTTYRTVCVRLCDGYYWPISFATTPDRFGRDAAACERSCSSSARLFVYRNPGEQPEQMVDLKGRPYTRLQSAFLYRTSYDASCRCRPQAWEQESLDRHRMYALQAEQRKGSRARAAELEALKARLASKLESGEAPAQRRAQLGSDPVMRLGAESSAPDRGRRSGTSAGAGDDWKRRVFER